MKTFTQSSLLVVVTATSSIPLFCTQVSSFGISQLPKNTRHSSSQKTQPSIMMAKKSNDSNEKKENVADRRSFLHQAFISSGLIGASSTTTFSYFQNMHEVGCSCGMCIRMGPVPAAYAYERDVGNENRSPETDAMNRQARETNARLEASGFKLDTKEEEAQRLNDAFASFSYDSINNSSSSSSSRQGGSKSKKNSVRSNTTTKK